MGRKKQGASQIIWLHSQSLETYSIHIDFDNVEDFRLNFIKEFVLNYSWSASTCWSQYISSRVGMGDTPTWDEIVIRTIIPIIGLCNELLILIYKKRFTDILSLLILSIMPKCLKYLNFCDHTCFNITEWRKNHTIL